MLHGDLAETSLSATLHTLAQEWLSGCLHVVDPDGGEALVYLRHGAIYFIDMPRPGRQIGARLVSSGALLPEALAEALDAQDGALQAWRLGELLVRLGYVGQAVVEAFVIEQLLEDGASLLALTAGQWQFVEGESTREGIAGGLPAAELLHEVIERQRAWSRLAKLVPGSRSVPRLSASGLAADSALDLSSDAWAVLAHVDGRRPVWELAETCGFTLFEATYVIAKLVHSGSLDIIDESQVEAEADSYPGSGSDSEPDLTLATVLQLHPEPVAVPEAEPATMSMAEAPTMPMVEASTELYAEPDAWQAAALLSELSRDYGADAAEEPEPYVGAEPPAEAEPEEPAMGMAPALHLNDTASLMRELSFLGVDEPPASPPAPTRPPRPHTPAVQKKRKGIFGR